MVEIQKLPDTTIIKLTPNRSATWRETKIAIGIMVVLVMTIAFGWAAVGAWVILPFAGLEVGLFAYFMYRICRQGFNQQIVTITKEFVLIESGIMRREVARTYDRNQLSFEVAETERDWHLPDIVMCLGMYRLSIGEFLNKDDRIKLKDALKNNGLPLSRTHWWKD
ncbi:DUF2244 domain-containing protein [Alteromonas sp. LMIT006]|jgi:uncharacterized membrane protein|uniref:DUF2244 domain-containing protein n=1 Tax=Alteromonadaceae TaxID=72275 RepID=UPI0020CA7FD0|nr:DUF2244 domain-containing protein [Alteromonas sp. LMIT006]UTP72534.1 DUF2244 domain-containing protein [Alteromonas sp. LMIT006]